MAIPKHKAVVVGAGPTGVAAALALIEAKVPVLLLDAGKPDAAILNKAMAPLAKARRGSASKWDWMLGRSFGKVDAGPDASPKLRVHLEGSEISEWQILNRLNPDGFSAIGLSLQGGLSSIWGAMTPMLGREELVEMGLPIDDMTVSYRRVGSRIGISGPNEGMQAPLNLSVNAERMLSAQERSRRGSDFRLSRPQQAVLSQPKGSRGSCTACGGCLWGCPEGAIYNAGTELDTIIGHSCLTFRAATTVRSITKRGRVFRLLCTNGASESIVEAEHVVLAAGHLPTSRLVLTHLKMFDRPLRFFHAPAFAFAVLHPMRICAPIPERHFGMAQLAFETSLPAGEVGRIYGAIYDSVAVSPSDVFSSTPIGIGGIAGLARGLMPSISLVFGYLPGQFSSNTMVLEKTMDEARLKIIGSMPREQLKSVSRCARKVSLALARLGAIRIPGSSRIYQPGTEVHAGAGLAAANIIDIDGAVTDAPGLHVVDTSALRSIPSKHPTFTAMANADRIARKLAQRLGGNANY